MKQTIHLTTTYLIVIILAILLKTDGYSQSKNWYHLQEPRLSKPMKFYIDRYGKIYEEEMKWVTTDKGLTWERSNYQRIYDIYPDHTGDNTFAPYFFSADSSGFQLYDFDSAKWFVSYVDSAWSTMRAYYRSSFTYEFSYQNITGEMYLSIQSPYRLLKSTDLGRTWKKIESSLNDVAVRASDAKGNLYGYTVKVLDSNVKVITFVSSDGAATWDTIWTPQDLGGIELGMKEDGGAYVIKYKDRDVTLYVTDAKGKNWQFLTSLNHIVHKGIYYGSPKSLSVTKNNVLLLRVERQNDESLLRSTDNGLTWKNMFEGNYTRSFQAPFIDKDNYCYINVGIGTDQYDVSDSFNFYVSSDEGATWQTRGIPKVNVNKIYVDKSKDIVYAPGNKMLTDSMRKSTTINIYDPVHSVYSEYRDCYLNGLGKLVCYTTNDSGRFIMEQTDSGSWDILYNGFLMYDINYFCRPNDSVLFVKGIDVSNPGKTKITYTFNVGESWQVLPEYFFSDNSEIKMTESYDHGVYLFGSRSSNKIAHMSDPKKGFKFITTIFSSIQCLSYGSSGNVYIGDRNNRIAFSSNYGESWENISNGLVFDSVGSSPWVNCILEMPNKDLYAGTDNGLYYRNTSDTAWKRIIFSKWDSTVLSLASYDDTTVLVGTIAGIYSNYDFPTLKPMLAVSKPNMQKLPTSAFVCYPNPASDEMRIRYSLEKSGEVQIAIFDMTGRPVAVPIDKVMDVGEHEVLWDTRSVPSGSYLIEMKSNGSSNTKTVTIFR